MFALLFTQVLLTGVLGFLNEAQASAESENWTRCSEIMENSSAPRQNLWQQSSSQFENPEYRRAEKARIFFSKLRNSIEAHSRSSEEVPPPGSPQLEDFARSWRNEIESAFSCTLSGQTKASTGVLRFETLPKIWDDALVQSIAAWRELEKRGLTVPTRSRVLASLQICISTQSNLRNPQNRKASLQNWVQRLSEEEKIQVHSLLVRSEFWGLIDEARAHLCATAVQ